MGRSLLRVRKHSFHAGTLQTMTKLLTVVAIFCVFSTFFAAQPILAYPSPVQCTLAGCTIHNYQHMWADRSPCRAARLAYPTSEEELIHAVAHAVQHQLKIKVVSQGSHSIPKLVCPGGHNGVIVSTQYLNSMILVNETARTVSVDAGVGLRDLINRVAEFGLALTHSPYWEGVSVAGLISTGAHGSGLWGKGSAVHEYVVAMRLVIPAPPEQGYARVIELTQNDDDLNAARVSLGVLGAISQVTFALEPMFKRSVTLEIQEDWALEDQVESFARNHEFGTVFWYPSQKKALMRLDDRVSVDVEGTGSYNQFALYMQVNQIEAARAAHEAIEAQKDGAQLCKLSEFLLYQRLTFGDGLFNDETGFQNYPVVGFNHLIQSSGGCQGETSGRRPSPSIFDSAYSCLETAPKPNDYTCYWDPRIQGIFFFDTAISIPMTRIKEAIKDVKEVVDSNPNAMCSVELSGGIWLRFVKKSSAYLGEKEDAVIFEFVYYRSREPNTPRLNEDHMEEIEQLLLHKYGGKPHWGKNRNFAFAGMEHKTLSLTKFMEVKAKLDAEGLFSSEWSDAILGTEGSSGVEMVREYCAVEGLCRCSEDEHCAPERGYHCRAGRVLAAARVCRYEEESVSAALDM